MGDDLSRIILRVLTPAVHFQNIGHGPIGQGAEIAWCSPSA
ncbi:hypothetical protein [Sphingobium sp. Sx8-8]|nr:hypothetical protein [Sphingobium sp. Sx8-8]